MCLSALTGTREVKRPLTVYKLVFPDKNKNVCLSFVGQFILFGTPPTIYKVGLNSVRVKRELKCQRTNDTYTAGYHCFTSKKKARSFRRAYSWTGAVLWKFIIPADTTLMLGEQFGIPVVVSPVIINPGREGRME